MSSLFPYLDDKKYTFEYFCQDNVCRLCWSETNTIAVENFSIVYKKILEYIGIDITSGFPKKVCNMCISQIKKFMYFKQRCQEAEIKLKFILKNACEENDDDLTIVSNEAALELKLLAQEMSENIYGLIVKDKLDCKFKIDDSPPDYGDLLPNDDHVFAKVDDLLPKEENNLISEAVLTNNQALKDDNQFRSYHGQFLKVENPVSKNGKQFPKPHLRLKSLDDLISKADKFPKDSTRYIYRLNFDTDDNNTKSKENMLCKTIDSEKQLSFAHKTDHEMSLCKAINKFSCNVRKRVKDKKKVLERNRAKCICEICGQLYSRNSFSIHMAIHAHKKKYKCLYCNYCTTLKASLNTHIKSHTGEKPYACDQCPYRCITSSNLNKHLKTHTNVKDYKCHVCNKSYRHNASLRAHITTTHEGKKNYKCKQCGMEYFHFKGLRKHLLIKHGLKVKKVKDDFVEVDESYTRRNKLNTREAGMDDAEVQAGQKENKTDRKETKPPVKKLMHSETGRKEISTK